jgi:hypothetical protein
MRRTIKLKKRGIKILKDIRNDIRAHGYSLSCPHWDEIAKLEEDRGLHKCDICFFLFPKALATCPCNLYTPKYLVKRLTEIIEYNRNPK